VELHVEIKSDGAIHLSILEPQHRMSSEEDDLESVESDTERTIRMSFGNHNW